MSIISITRLALTFARGKIILTIEIIKNANIICIAYWIQAIISPTWIVPSSTPYAPTQTIVIHTTFMISIIIGIIIDIVLLTNKLTLVKLSFAASNLSSSCFSFAKARITGIPVNISRETWFNLSVRTWSFVNLGITKINNDPIITISAKIANPTINNIVAPEL